MENLKASLAAKMISVILVIVCVVSFAVSLTAMLMLDGGGFYNVEKEETLQKGFERISTNYSIVAMSYYQEDFGKEELSGTNFRYGVIRSDDLEKVDFTDASSYIAGDFTNREEAKNLSEEDLYIYECSINEDSIFILGHNLLDSFSISRNYEESYENKEYPLDGYYFDRFTGQIYVRSGKKLFPVHFTSGYKADGTDFYEESLQDYMIYGGSDGQEHTLVWDSALEAVELEEGTVISLDDIQITDSSKLDRLGSVSDEVLEHLDAETIYTLQRKEPKLTHYYVVSDIRMPLGGAQSFQKGDMFVQMNLLVDFAYRIRYLVIVIVILSLLVFLAAFSFLMSAAGHHKGKPGISRGFLSRLPLDMHFAGAAFAGTMLTAMAMSYLAQMDYLPWDGVRGYVSFLVFAAFAAIAGILLVLSFCTSFAVNLKLGKWWQNTFLYWICKKCMKTAGRCVHVVLSVMNGLCKSLTLLWKVWLVLGFLALAEYIAIVSFSYGYSGELLGAWFMEKLILYPIIIFLLMQMNRLQKGAQRIASGELNYRIYTDRMFWEMKKHGDYLNDIGTGMNRAVNERLKSEHFKTELITNVSHDIKTPLTSIINYVDLLQKEMRKEEPSAVNVQDYLDVLHRQSARLKKLIEDLMEASKASTGSLSVIMEKCDAGVTLVQTVGEFEEKLMENQIELQIKKPEESIFIEADSRHLWRVFDNLMNNICKYAQPHTRAYINLEQDDMRAMVIFRNISKCQLNITSEELMERFVRGDSSRNTEGNGLGISIAKSLTELMDGRFDLIVDGDLFKVVLSFPLYGQPQPKKQGWTPDPGIQPENFGGGQKYQKKNKEESVSSAAWNVDGLAAGIHHAGVHAVKFGSRILDLTGHAFHAAGKMVQQAGQAVRQPQDEEKEKTAQTKADIDAQIDEAVMGSGKNGHQQNER